MEEWLKNYDPRTYFEEDVIKRIQYPSLHGQLKVYPLDRNDEEKPSEEPYSDKSIHELLRNAPQTIKERAKEILKSAPPNKKKGPKGPTKEDK